MKTKIKMNIWKEKKKIKMNEKFREQTSNISTRNAIYSDESFSTKMKATNYKRGFSGKGNDEWYGYITTKFDGCRLLHSFNITQP